MRVLLIALLAAISYAQTAFGNCEANLTPETCTGNGDDGYPCQWHYGDNSCKENSDGGLPTGGSTSGGDMPMGDFPVTQGGDMPMGDFPVTQGGVVYGNDGCEEFLEATCSTQAGENGESCHWVIGEGCKKADCEHFLTSETCTGKTGEHGRACVFLADEGCEETPGIGGNDGTDVNNILSMEIATKPLLKMVKRVRGILEKRTNAKKLLLTLLNTSTTRTTKL